MAQHGTARGSTGRHDNTKQSCLPHTTQPLSIPETCRGCQTRTRSYITVILVPLSLPVLKYSFALHDTSLLHSAPYTSGHAGHTGLSTPRVASPAVQAGTPQQPVPTQTCTPLGCNTILVETESPTCMSLAHLVSKAREGTEAPQDQLRLLLQGRQEPPQQPVPTHC